MSQEAGSTSERTYAFALRTAMAEEMRRDRRIVLLGEDIGAYGGAFKVTAELFNEFGPTRVRDTPISENAIVGAAVGAALDGLVPVVEIQYAGFATLAMDAIVTHAAFLRYMTGGQFHVPIVVRMPLCQYKGAGAQHSLTAPVAWFSHVPGLSVVAPAFPYDAKGLFKAAVRQNDPVIFFEHVELYRKWNKSYVPEEDYAIPIGSGEVKREGSDLTIVSYSLGVHRSLESASLLEKQGVNAEVIDLRTVAPLDKELILRSCRKTGRLIAVDPDFKTGGVSAEIVSTVSEEALYSLVAPVRRVASVDVPVPFSPALEELAFPRTEDIVKASVSVMKA